MLDVTSTGEVVVPITAKLRVGDDTLFAVTVEHPGGVVVSRREHIVVTAGGGPPPSASTRALDGNGGGRSQQVMVATINSPGAVPGLQRDNVRWVAQVRWPGTCSALRVRRMT